MATEARHRQQAEELTLLVAKNTTGYFGVSRNKPGRPKPYKAHVRRGGKDEHLGSFATAEEAALCVARTPEGQAAAAERAAAVAPLTSEEVQQQAQAEKLTLLVADNQERYFGVITPLKVLNEDACLVMSAANGDDASNPRAKVSELSEKVVDTNPYSRLMCAGRHRHACCAVD